MKLLLCKSVDKLGIVGDIVEVSSGYGRNYLVPHGLATSPTGSNIRKLAEARRVAEQEQIRHREELQRWAERLEGVEVTVRARANEDGVLYGSVGRKEIAAVLVEEGYPVSPEHVSLDTPIRHLDNVAVEIKLSDELHSNVKVWVVREKSDSQGEETPEEDEVGKEAGADDDRSIE